MTLLPLLLLLLWSLPAEAAMDAALLPTLRAAIDADPTLASKPHTNDGDATIAFQLNQPAVPTFYVWRTVVPVSEIMGNGFDWTVVDNLTVGKARIWEWMTTLATLNCAAANVRAGVIAVFTTAGQTMMRLQIFGHCQAPATRGETLFATGDGTTTTDQGTGPAVRAFEGLITADDVDNARNLP